MTTRTGGSVAARDAQGTRCRCAAGLPWLAVLLLCASTATVRGQAPAAAAPDLAEPPATAPAWIAGYRIRIPLRVVGDIAGQNAKSVIARLPVGSWLKPDGSDVAIQNAAGAQIPVHVLSHDPKGDTIVQFARNGDDRWYWAYVLNPAAPPAAGPALPEGLVGEYRQWAGDDLGSWAAVVGGLHKSENVIGNAIVSEVIQNCNPARPGEPRQFAASYRGFLDIKEAGTYRFFVNSEDAAFLFIDGKMVTERTGSQPRVTGKIPIAGTGTALKLAKGVHPFEVHHVIGNTPSTYGFCALLWLSPGSKAWEFVQRAALAMPLYAQCAGLEEAARGQAAIFEYGIDDTLTSGGVTLYLVRFEAEGSITKEAGLTWDFGDGLTGTGKSQTHVYFKPGDYDVTLTSAAGLTFTRRVHVWPAPTPTSPLSLGKAIQSIAASRWTTLELPAIRQIFEFLQISEHPDRWPLLEKVARHLLQQPAEADPQTRALLYAALMESLAAQAKASEAVKLGETAVGEFAKLTSLQLTVKLALADVYHRYLKQPADASKIYQDIVDNNRRLEHPNVRLAAIRYGDLFVDAGDLTKAGEAYRLASTLGGSKFRAAAQAEAVTRGTLLRVAEQKLRSGDVRESRRLLQQIELDYPEQKLEGLYNFLRAEADRVGGRYEDAIRNYEVLLLGRWEGFRDRALFGMADAHYRKGDDERALEWLASLEESFPDFYEAQKVGDYQRSVMGRLKRMQGTGPTGGTKSLFTDYQTGFEPAAGSGQPLDKPGPFRFVRALGIDGPYVGLLDNYPVVRGSFDCEQRLRNLTSDGTVWLELWYRDELLSIAARPHIHAWLYGTGDTIHPGGGLQTVNPDRTWGGWRKIGFRLRAPVTQDGRLKMSWRHFDGVVEIDGLKITAVSDRELDTLANFVEGTEAP